MYYFKNVIGAALLRKALMRGTSARNVRLSRWSSIFLWQVARSLCLFVVVGLVCGCAADPLLDGDASSWTGNQATDLATIHVHYDGPAPYQLRGSIFDNGTVVFAGQQHAPGAWCLETGAVQGALLSGFGSTSGGPTQIREGNEVMRVGSMLYPFDIKWSRLPGPLVVLFYVDNGGSNGHIASQQMDAIAGKTYNYTIIYSNGALSIYGDSATPPPARVNQGGL